MLREKGIPLYYQLETILRKKILAGDYSPGATVPSEAALAEEYGISRITVRQALASLEQDNLVVRQRGKGTFVTQQVRGVALPRFTGSIEDLVLMGLRTSIRLIESGWLDPPERVREALRVKGEKVLRIEKVRSIEGGPFSHVVNFLPPSVGEKLPMEEVTVKPLLMILEDALGIRATEAHQSVEATIADAEIASLLKIRVGDPLLKTERTVFDERHRPVEYVSVLYRADKYAFTMKLRRQRTKHSAAWGAA